MMKFFRSMKNKHLFELSALFEGMYFYVPIMTVFLVSKSITVQHLLLGQMLFSMGVMLGEVPTGAFGDKYGHKLSVIIGYSGEALLVLCMFLFPNPIAYMVILFARGIMGSFASGSDNAILYESIKETEPKESVESVYIKSQNTIGANVLVGTLISSVVAAFVYAKMGESAFGVLFVGTVCAVVIATLILCFLRPVKSNPDTVALSQKEGSKFFDYIREGFKFIKTSKLMWAIVLLSLVTMSGIHFANDMSPVLFQKFDVPNIWYGLSFTISAIVGVLVLRGLSVLFSKTQAQKAIISLISLLAVSFLVAGLVRNAIILVVVIIALRVFADLYESYVSAITNKYIPSHLRATILSSVSFVKRIYQTVIYFVLSLVVARISIGSTFILWGIYLLVCCAVIYVIFAYLKKNTQVNAV
jgi:MFS family permease